MISRVKVVITGYYDVNSDFAEQNYGTTDKDKILAIDQESIDSGAADPIDVLGWMDETPAVELSWDN